MEETQQGRYSILESQDGHTNVVAEVNTLQEANEKMKEYEALGIVTRCRFNKLGQSFIGPPQRIKLASSLTHGHKCGGKK